MAMISYSFRAGAVLVAALVLAAPAVAQTAPGGRGAGARGGASGAPAAAFSGRSGRSIDPRPAFEEAETRIKKIDEAELNRPPKRDYQIEVGAAQKTKLFRADPKLFENKFMATMTVAPPHGGGPIRGGDPRNHADFPAEMRQLTQFSASGQIFSGPGTAIENHKVFRLLAERCLPDQRPESALKFLTSAECDRDVKGRFGGSQLIYFIYAPTPEEAAARTAAVLRLIDCGASRPLQQYFLTEAQKHLTRARAACDEFAKLSDEIPAEEEKIAKPSEVSPDILSQLKAQRVMVAVELAGLNARVKACDSMLNEPKRLEVSTLQSISDMKVKAEIERIGTKEKLDQINSFIAEGDRREGIQQNIIGLNRRRDIAAQLASNATVAADTCAILVEYYAPRELDGNKIVVSPIEWTE
jgi:hypothetical protein